MLQVFDLPNHLPASPKEQDPDLPTLFCLIGKKGLLAGLVTPRDANGLYPGGTKFLPTTGTQLISRAGAKFAEALHHLTLFQPIPKPGAHWLELGASPGGMTAELLRHKYRVTAVDRARLDERLAKRPDLLFIQENAAAYEPPADTLYDGLLCDLNDSPVAAIQTVLRYQRFMKSGAPLIFTLKTTGITGFAEMNRLDEKIREIAKNAALKHLATIHLSYNRQEFTMLFCR